MVRQNPRNGEAKNRNTIALSVTLTGGGIDGAGNCKLSAVRRGARDRPVIGVPRVVVCHDLPVVPPNLLDRVASDVDMMRKPTPVCQRQ